jgi:hypothetical protein
LQTDPIGFSAKDVNLYRYCGNNSINRWDSWGLEESGGQCTDDAGQKCCCKDIKSVQLLIDNSDVIGHAAIRTPNHTVGFYPLEEASEKDYFDGTNSVPGGTIEDAEHPFNEKLTRSYKACPDTVSLLELLMLKHGKDRYQIGNRGARNCAGWACARLQDAGFKPPKPPDTEKLRPHDLVP